MINKILIILALIFVFNFSNFAQQQSTCYPWVTSIHTELGVPCDNDTTNNYIIIRPQYVLSYNSVRGVPNWVAWNLNADW
ncbi:MAG: hypothetical protein WCT77_00835 [Bacteroidota bacterium]